MTPRDDMSEPKPCGKAGYKGGNNETLCIHGALPVEAEPSASKKRHERAAYQKLQSQQSEGKEEILYWANPGKGASPY